MPMHGTVSYPDHSINHSKFAIAAGFRACRFPRLGHFHNLVSVLPNSRCSMKPAMNGREEAFQKLEMGLAVPPSI